MTDKDKQFSLGLCDIQKHDDEVDDEEINNHVITDPSLQMPNQGVFNFDGGNEKGVEEYRKKININYERISDEWELPINKRVRVSLVDFDGVYEGVLQVVEMPSLIDKSEPLYLRVANVCFYSVDIEKIELLHL